MSFLSTDDSLECLDAYKSLYSVLQVIRPQFLQARKAPTNRVTFGVTYLAPLSYLDSMSYDPRYQSSTPYYALAALNIQQCAHHVKSALQLPRMSGCFLK